MNLIRRPALFLLLLTLPFYGAAQRQVNVWTFGDSTGFDFNTPTGNPVVIRTSFPMQMDWCSPGLPQGRYNEGGSNICDSAGALLMYTNGEKVWNRFGRVMPHGDSLFGHFSAPQAAMILPQPGSNSRFYVFTMASFLDTFRHGLTYSVVDACLDSGRGDVMPVFKNIPLLDSTGEKFTAVRHANGQDYWIIAHKHWTNRFYAFRLTASGVRDTVITAIGRRHLDSLAPGSPASAIGNLVAAPNGRHLLVISGNTSNNNYITDLFDFDPATGILSNYIDLKTRLTANGAAKEPYGCTFSPGSTKIYIGSMVIANSGGIPVIAQYDLSMGTQFPDSIRQSVQWLRAANADSVQNALGTAFYPAGFQIGPNGRIYITGNSTLFQEILYPDQAGIACSTRINTAQPIGRTWTLPNILASRAYGNRMVSCQSRPTGMPAIGDTGFRVYPNPAAESLVVEQAGDWTATLRDLSTGRTIRTIQGNGRNTLERAGAPPGIYLLRLQTAGSVKTVKLVFR